MKRNYTSVFVQMQVVQGWGAVLLVSRIHVGFMLDEKLANVDMAFYRRPNQRILPTDRKKWLKN
jgi:hypothetical protein